MIHGKQWAYQHHGCRCSWCIGWARSNDDWTPAEDVTRRREQEAERDAARLRFEQYEGETA